MRMFSAIFKAVAPVTLTVTMTLGLLLGSTALQADTLADALAAGYENSGLLEQNRALLRVADEDVAQAVAALMPIINWSAQVSAIDGQTAERQSSEAVNAQIQISAELTLYDGGSNRLAIETQKELVLATRESLISDEQQVMLRVVQAYMNVRRSNEFVNLRESNTRLITQELRAAQDRFEVGEVTRTDVSLAEARLASARSQLAAEQGGLARALAEYEAAVGIPARNLAATGPAPVGQSIPQAIDLAMRQHPAIRQAQHSVAAAELGIARAEAAMRPTVTLNGSVTLNDVNDSDGFFLDPGQRDFEQLDVEQLGLNIGGPIYQGGRLSSQVRQFMARRDASRSNLLVVTQGVEQTVLNAYSQLEVARASRDASERQVRAAQAAFDGIREEATLGARTTLDVLNAEQELLDARANLISAMVDETVASYTVLSSMGLLTAQHLGLNVQLYDPAAYYNLVKDAPTNRSEQGAALDRVLEAIGD
jgi:outer membrane protein